MGRRKIEIQPLTDERNRTVTFVKRKAGLFKKAHELSVLCQVDLAIIIVGNNNKLYEFSSVDTNELIKAYQSTKPHESKSPANYGNYKKKKNLTISNNQISMNDDIMDDIDDSDSDSDTPEPKRQKRNFDTMKEKIVGRNQDNSSNNSTSTATNNNNNTNNQNNQNNNMHPTNLSKRGRPLPPNHISLSSVPAFNSFHKTGIKEEDEEMLRPDMIGGQHSTRPILRVQIPTDSKSGNDSARTLTALDTNPPKQSGILDKVNGKSPTINTPKYSNFSTFRSPDTRKPITTLPLPIQLKSQTSSPSSANAPPLPRDGMTSFYNPLPNPSPTQYPNSSITTPILNQVLGDKFKSGGSTSSSNSQNQSQNLLQQQQQQQQHPLNIHANANNPNNPNTLTGDTPVLGLPSKYVDMFPSPLGFYPQEWSTNNMTPYSNLNQYFFRHGQGQTPGGGPQQQQQHQQHQQQPQQQQQTPMINQSSSNPGTNQSQPQLSQTQQSGVYPFPSPTQFMNQFEEKKE